MVKILLIGDPLRYNLGGPSILLSVAKILRSTFPNSHLTFISPASYDSSLNPKEYLLDEIVVRPKNILKRLIFLVKEIMKANILIDVRGIIFTDKFKATPPFYMLEYFYFLLGKLLGKYVIKYTADMGPFNNFWNRFFAKLYLNRIDIIFARSYETERYLRKIGVKTTIFVSPDVAFILDLDEGDICKAKRELQVLLKGINCRRVIGISVSHTITKFEKKRGLYLKVMSDIIDYLTKKWNSCIILIPNEISPYMSENDLSIAEKIYNLISDKKRVRILRREYSAKHLKSIIGLCEVLIGSRYHSIVAALSQGVPVIAVGWHHKYRAILSLFDCENFVFNINDLNLDRMYEAIDYVLKNNIKIREKITIKLKCVIKNVFLTGNIIKLFFYSNYGKVL